MLELIKLKKFSKTIIIIILLLASIYSVTSYFNYAGTKNGIPTFPLDDVWIFWGYARTFAETGVFSLNPATPPGTGVTSPGYTLLLSGMIKLGFTNEFTVSFLFNCFFLFISAVLLFKIVQKYSENVILSGVLALLLIFNWRTATIANSGMETFLFISILLGIFYSLDNQRFELASLLMGLGFWIRPEIVILVCITIIIYRKQLKWRLALFFLIPFVTYFVFLFLATGHYWLNTGKAKEDFYSFISRWDYIKESLIYFGKTSFPFILILFPISLWLEFKKNKLVQSISLFILLFWLAYLVKLPVLYHFGRYVFPLVPLMLVGSIFAIAKLTKKKKYLGYIVILAALSVSAFHFWEGREIYARECQNFIRLHILMSAYINEKLPPDSSIATHDIGAIGYFSKKRIIDLIGLLDAKSVGISRNPEKLKTFLTQQKCDYIAVLNSWFLVKGAPLIYETPEKSVIKFCLYKYTPETQIIRLDVYQSQEKK